MAASKPQALGMVAPTFVTCTPIGLAQKKTAGLCESRRRVQKRKIESIGGEYGRMQTMSATVAEVARDVVGRVQILRRRCDLIRGAAKIIESD